MKLKKKEEVKLNIVNAIELKPECSYILVVDGDHIDRKQVNTMLKDLNKTGIKNVVSFMLSGSPDDAIQLVTKRTRTK